MEKQGVKTRDLVEMALFAAIIVILAFTPLGYIPLGVITPTTVHIPVIIAGIILGWKKGAFAGVWFNKFFEGVIYCTKYNKFLI